MKSRPILAGLCALSLATAPWAQAEDSAQEGQNPAPAAVATPAPAEPAATAPAPNTGELPTAPAPAAAPAEPAKQASPTPPAPAAEETASKSGVSEISRRRIRETRRKLDELLWR
jgi:hypothetical protein